MGVFELSRFSCSACLRKSDDDEMSGRSALSFHRLAMECFRLCGWAQETGGFVRSSQPISRQTASVSQHEFLKNYGNAAER